MLWEGVGIWVYAGHLYNTCYEHLVLKRCSWLWFCWCWSAFEGFPGDCSDAEIPEKNRSSSERSLTSHQTKNGLEVSVPAPGKMQCCLSDFCVKAQLLGGEYGRNPPKSKLEKLFTPNSIEKYLLFSSVLKFLLLKIYFDGCIRCSSSKKA